ncbi:hypothetical protein MJO55_06835 [Mycolicibacterium rufum]|uniref:PPE family protein n=1 Tax=Mycolicibacterium rufum TaxID=318424 RepID=A0ABY3UIU6_9MYCO|nr:hypothetical protein [Mycolicibacterium rufum]ULP38136.1 hypothetical protein MJO55_06835 [Mycolicibacterium rufum]
MRQQLQQLQELSPRAVVPPRRLNPATPAPSASRPTFPPPPTIPPPVVTAFEFEDAIINTYHAIEPWVRYGFELATYAVGWVPWVGWLAPQIMIFYNFGERIVESLVVNSANWLWGPLPFGEGLANVARDSWDALVQLGRDEWNFWLPPLPPLPLTAEQTTDPAQDGITGTVDEPAAPSAVRPHPVRDALLALAHSLPVRPGAPHNTVRPRLLERIVHQPAAPDTDATPDGEVEGAAAPVDSRNDGIAPTDSDLPIPEPEKADDASQGDTRSADATGDSQQSGGAAEGAEKPSAAGDGAAHTPRWRGGRDAERRGPQFRHERRAASASASSSADS